MSPAEWKSEAIRLSFHLASIRESREASRGEVALAQADFAAHFDALDQVFLDIYAEGRADERSEWAGNSARKNPQSRMSQQ